MVDTQHFDPAFAGALNRFMADSPGITVYSGFRSIARQGELFRGAVQKYGSEAAARKFVAPPGKSEHNYGTAADLRYASGQARQWAHDNAGKYGLNYPMSWEPWHIEPIGARSRPNQIAQAGSPQVPPGSDEPSQAQAGATFPPLGVVPAPLQPLDRDPGADDSQRWLDNTSYSGDAILSDLFAGQNPLKRFAYQKLASIF